MLQHPVSFWLLREKFLVNNRLEIDSPTHSFVGGDHYIAGSWGTGLSPLQAGLVLDTHPNYPVVHRHQSMLSG